MRAVKFNIHRIVLNGFNLNPTQSGGLKKIIEAEIRRTLEHEELSGVLTNTYISKISTAVANPDKTKSNFQIANNLVQNINKILRNAR